MTQQWFYSEVEDLRWTTIITAKERGWTLTLRDFHIEKIPLLLYWFIIKKVGVVLSMLLA